jgi:hypothetical protein
VTDNRKHNAVRADRGMEVQLHELLRSQPDVPTLGTTYILGCVQPMMPGTQQSIPHPPYILVKTDLGLNTCLGICLILFQTSTYTPFQQLSF